MNNSGISSLYSSNAIREGILFEDYIIWHISVNAWILEVLIFKDLHVKQRMPDIYLLRS
jgi:hypothetical protein